MSPYQEIVQDENTNIEKKIKIYGVFKSKANKKTPYFSSQSQMYVRFMDH